MQKTWEGSPIRHDKLPGHLVNTYLGWRSKLSSLNDMKLKRLVLLDGFTNKIDVHLFCDASEKAYAACIYIVASTNNGITNSSLLVDKTKKAPIKFQSIPRLELCTALLSARLLKSTLNAINHWNLQIGTQYAWTDSTIVLSLLSREPSHWSNFVSNRVSEIQGQNSIGWNHLRSEDNPADPASRGIDTDAIQEHSLWWKGPDWFITGSFLEPFFPEEVLEEQKKTKIISFHASTALNQDVFDLSKYNSPHKALRVLAYVKRFVSKLEKELNDFPRYVTASELVDATKILLRPEQRKAYSDKIKTLEIAPQVKKESKTWKFCYFLDDGVLYLGGRLAYANLPDGSKYQRLIPQNSQLARLVVSNAHLSTLHGGTTQVMAHIRTRFWIPSCRSLVRKLVLYCVGCNRFNVKPQYPLMRIYPKNVSMSQQMLSKV